MDTNISEILEKAYATQVAKRDVTDFTTMDLDDNNLIDLDTRAAKGDIIGIVDESKGGIIAYAIGQEHADQIQAALTLHKLQVNTEKSHRDLLQRVWSTLILKGTEEENTLIIDAMAAGVITNSGELIDYLEQEEIEYDFKN